MLHSARRSARTSVEKRRFGPLQREVSIIGQGTWYIEEGDPASAIAGLRRGIDLGMNHIDTAEMYGAGATEKLVGEAGRGTARPAAGWQVRFGRSRPTRRTIGSHPPKRRIQSRVVGGNGTRPPRLPVLRNR
jgi:hypothetical protein